MAYCFDEAVHIWGTYVEGELKEAASKAKTDKQAQQKVLHKSQQLLTQPKEDSERVIDYQERKAQPVPKGKFRDPSTMFRGSSK